MSAIWTEVTSQEDSRYRDALEIYHTSFPDEERMTEQWESELLRPGHSKGTEILLAGIDCETGNTVAMALYELHDHNIDELRSHRLAYLMYFAVHADYRGKHIGSELYSSLIERISQRDSAFAMLFEVESPTEQISPERAEAARKRIDWYRRMGAKLVPGAICQVYMGHGSPVPMLLMIDTRYDITPQNVVDLYTSSTGQAVDINGEPFF